MSAFFNPTTLRTLGANNSSLLSDLGTSAGVARQASEKNKDTRANPNDPNKNPLSIDGLITFLSDTALASTNRFMVEFFGPFSSPGESGAASGVASTDKTQTNLSLSCESASFPGRGVETNIISRTYGPHRKTPTNLIFTDITFTFRCSEDHREKQFFENWMNVIISKSTYDFGYYRDYAKTVKIHQLSRGGEAKGPAGFFTHSVELEEAYPTRIDEIPLDYNADNAIEKMNVTFTFFKWRNI